MPKGHRQVESGPSFLIIRRREINRDLGWGDIIAAILQRGAHAVAALANGCVRQAHGVEVVLIALDARAVDLHLNDIGVDAINSCALRVL